METSVRHLQSIAAGVDPSRRNAKTLMSKDFIEKKTLQLENSDISLSFYLKQMSTELQKRKPKFEEPSDTSDDDSENRKVDSNGQKSTEIPMPAVIPPHSNAGKTSSTITSTDATEVIEKPKPKEVLKIISNEIIKPGKRSNYVPIPLIPSARTAVRDSPPIVSSTGSKTSDKESEKFLKRNYDSGKKEFEKISIPRNKLFIVEENVIEKLKKKYKQLIKIK
ncbi:uncharacterized protein LOC130666789 [Microplitis mediator]|uniref:uncharacterized protein LOC130666789 n=1 Tax=Microplitis mediator TaxID=375433 RepID=UPI002552BE81|nr:uncharacterized protein LOC130666789 [Microplitis mediator]